MRKRRPAKTAKSLADRLGWPKCHQAVTLNAKFAFGEYHGPAEIVAARVPDDLVRNDRPSFVVEFVHPQTGETHQAVVNQEEVQPCSTPN